MGNKPVQKRLQKVRSNLTVGTAKDLQTNLEARFRREINRFKEELAVQVVSEELSTLYDAATRIPLRDALSPAEVMDWCERKFISAPVSAPQLELMLFIAEQVRNFVVQRHGEIKTLLPHDSYVRLTENVLGLTRLRGELIRWAVESRIYPALAADLVWRMTGNFFSRFYQGAKKVPGWGLGLNTAQQLLSNRLLPIFNLTAKGLRTKLENFVKTRLQNRIGRYNYYSETFFENILDDSLLKNLGQAVYEALQEDSLSGIIEAVAKEDIEALAPILLEFWLHIRGTTFFGELLASVIKAFFEVYGDIPIQRILQEMGIPKDEIIGRMAAVGPDYLVHRIRNRLEKLTLPVRP